MKNLLNNFTSKNEFIKKQSCNFNAINDRLLLEKSITYITEYNKDGATGFVLNKKVSKPYLKNYSPLSF